MSFCGRRKQNETTIKSSPTISKEGYINKRNIVGALLE